MKTLVPSSMVLSEVQSLESDSKQLFATQSTNLYRKKTSMPSVIASAVAENDSHFFQRPLDRYACSKPAAMIWNE